MDKWLLAALIINSGLVNLAHAHNIEETEVLSSLPFVRAECYGQSLNCVAFVKGSKISKPGDLKFYQVTFTNNPPVYMKKILCMANGKQTVYDQVFLGGPLIQRTNEKYYVVLLGDFVVDAELQDQFLQWKTEADPSC